MCKGERRVGVGTGAVDGSLGEERNASVKSKDGVHVSAQLPVVTELTYLLEMET